MPGMPSQVLQDKRLTSEFVHESYILRFHGWTPLQAWAGYCSLKFVLCLFIRDNFRTDSAQVGSPFMTCCIRQDGTG